MNVLLSRLAACGAVLLLLSACAHRTPPQSPVPLLDDASFSPPQQAADASRVFAMSDAMRAYADRRLVDAAQRTDVRQALLAALYGRDQLQLGYDPVATRDPGQAFEARAGNCLSLVLMTASFAKYLGVPVTYQSAAVQGLYTRSGSLTMYNGHVNVVLGRASRRFDPTLQQLVGDNDLMVDFVPPDEISNMRFSPLAERTVVAMYFNNRAAELLADGQVNDSYWWAREALRQDPEFTTAANTLAVIYERAGHLQQAEAALRHVLHAEADNVPALSNLARMLRQAGRDSEAAAVGARLTALQPYPPFHFLDLGRQALQRGDAHAALPLLLRELAAQPYQPELHFWLAQAYLRLNDNARAASHLQLAVDHSPTRGEKQLYAAKLDLLRGRHLQ